ncbi:hypothetical protein [Actinomycetospora cinnamomea]|uniref:Uncharacterized protein n=1 Tax=Actinomycetospora cinnamomea TaxID=663609 RepID=A0A2U1FG82_9PSEU|nr:hypothetical protein [Actinomycetospora cinnamomea]PVZ11136.1 hypothetical protein C8D89_104351 [Actinomycetospora cinnamomea]
MTRVHIRTDDEVYRVDAVWLGPPRATFPWRARYSAYGVGLLVMIAVMFVQRRLGIDLGFFSVAWALLITVAITRFVSRRINDERPLLEWLTLFVHELRGPRAKERTIGGALTTGHVAVRRDRPRLTGASRAIALPRGSGGERVVRPRAGASDDADTWGPPPRDDEEGVAGRPSTPAAETPAGEPAAPAAPAVPAVPAVPAAPAEADVDAPAVPAPRTATPEAEPDGAHLTPGLEDADPSHARAASRRPRRAGTDGARRRTRARRTAGADSGPPAGADVGAPEKDRLVLPPAPDARTTAAADASMAAWTGGTGRREPVPARRTRRVPDRVTNSAADRAADADPDRTQRRPARPRRRPGWPLSNEPAGGSEPRGAREPFGPGTRARGDDGAAPR